MAGASVQENELLPVVVTAPVPVFTPICIFTLEIGSVLLRIEG